MENNIENAETQELKQKLNLLIEECQIKLQNIADIESNATMKKNAAEAVNTRIAELKSSSETSNVSISTLLQEIQVANSRISELKNLSETSNTSISSLLQDIETTKTEVGGTAQKAANLLNDITEKHQTLETHIKDFINKPNEQELSKVEKVNSAYQKVIENDANIEKVLSRMKEYEGILFGNAETQNTCLKNRMEDYEEEIKKKKNEWEDNYTTLYKKIDGLLPGATSTGLAYAYQSQGVKYQKPYWIWASVFFLITAGMIVFALFSLHDATSISDALMRIISRAPFFVPAVWLAVFASKQQSQNRRLQEEYAYKESLAKSYESYTREIEKLPNSQEKTKMLEKLIDAMVDMARFNPSQTLNLKQHNDKPPILSSIFDRKKEVKKED